MKSMIAVLAFLMISVMMNAYLLFFIYKIKNHNCPCANNTFRKIIQAYLVVILIANIAVIYMYMSGRRAMFKMYERAYLTFVVISAIIYSYVTYRYVQDLKQRNCTCSDTIVRLILEITTYITGGLFSFIGLIIGLSILFVILAYQKTKKR